MTITHSVLLFAAACLGIAEPMLAQNAGARGRAGPNRPLRSQRLETQDGSVPRRQQLELQIRRGLWRAAKVRIGLNDDQMTRLEQTSARFDLRRRQIGQAERLERLALRRQLLADSTSNQNAIGSSLDRLLQFQRQRLDIQEEEQKEFATFMTAAQRAKYTALQEQVRRRMQDLVRARPDSASGANQAPR